MNYVLSRHAQDELHRRQIPPELLDAVMQAPQQIVADQRGNRIYQSICTFDDEKAYLVRAVVADSSDPAIVITVYRTSQISRYWREI